MIDRLTAAPISLTRAQFRNRLLGIVGASNVRLLWMPRASDTTTSAGDETAMGAGRIWTADATMAGQIAAQGGGFARAFNGTANYLTTPDTADLSFGNGTTDQAFSIIALVNVTDTAAVRNIVNKWNGAATAREWQLFVAATDSLQLILRDESASVAPFRNSDAPITQGSWRLFGSTYSGAGGATAADGIVLYQDGVVLTSTAINQATYVAMEDSATSTMIGAQNAGASGFLDGSMTLVLVCAGVLTTAQMVLITQLCRRYFGAPS